MIWATEAGLEVIGHSNNSGIFGIFAAEVEEVAVEDRGVLAQHVVQLDEGGAWLVTTKAREVGFTTTCKQLHLPGARSIASTTRKDAMVEHFQQLMDLIAWASEPERAA